MSEEEKAYISGFLDGDGCIMAQLVRRKDYVYGYQVRISIVFYQKRDHKEILYWLKSKLHYGYIRDRNDNMSEYTIVGIKRVKGILLILYKFLRLKKELAELVLSLINKYPAKMNAEKLIELSEIVDKTAKLNYSKKRINTRKVIVDYLKTSNLYPRRD